MFSQLQSATFTLLAAIALVLWAPTTSADTIHVCWDGSGDYLTIQEGIDAAFDGDEVVVCDGTYTGVGNKNLDFGGRTITVRSACRADDCIIDCEHDGRGFLFHSGETQASIVEGFTICNGFVPIGEGDYDNHGGAIYCVESSPTIRNCTITGNEAQCHGGGIYCEDAAPTITNCVITGNTATWCGGGGIGGEAGNPTITDCTISDNTADWGGGVFFVYDTSPPPAIINCTISGNTAVSDGGGLTFHHAYAIIVNCAITGNTAGNAGGGLCPVMYSQITLTNCAISGNTARNGGGFATVMHTYTTITNCTFSGNTATEGTAGAFYGFSDTYAIFANCILWGNSPNEIWGYPENHEASYSDIRDGWPGEGNIDADPLFVDPDGPDNDPDTWEDNDYHIGAGSPCIDAGNNYAVPYGVTTDLDGNPRFVDDPDTPDTGIGKPPIVDMGAYEFQVGIPGDLDHDGDVDLSDLAQLLANYGTTSGASYEDGDIDGDGDVDLADLAALLANYGMGT